MKKMKFLSIAFIMAYFGIAIMFSSCLKMQKDYNRKTNVDTIDAHLNMTAWAYLKKRAYGSATDTIFRRMYDGIIYSGIDTNEYKKPGRTFIFLSNSEITTAKTGLWALVLNGTTPGKNWTSYSKTDVKNYLSYLIAQGLYSHYGLKLADVPFNTLAPAGVYTTNPNTFKFNTGTFVTNPNSIMVVHVSNANTVTSQLDYPIVINGTVNISSSDLEATNGIVQVVNSGTSVITPFLPQ
ncbi:MAG: hypothetical protein JWQ06_541 [Mucilaginibacter sp.]|nr:hypothetical protein [Mucilaginibacter sp.]